jgi:uncharacterized membrane protein YuzA (DUF378 family)
MVQVGLLLIRVDVVRTILGKGVELSRVVEYNVVALLKVQKLLQLGAEQTHRLVMCVEGSIELTPMGHGDQQVGQQCRKPTRLQLSL